MIENITKETVIDKSKEGLQKLNKLWDSGDKVNSCGVITVGLLGGLVFASRLSLVVLVIILGVQRLFYHGKFFTDEDQMPDIPDEDTQSE